MALDHTGVVVVVETNPEMRHTGQTMQADVEAYEKLTAGQTLPVVWDVRQMSRPTADGWRELMSRLPDILAALALVVDPDSRAITGAFPAAMNAFMFPSRVFEDVATASEWARQFVPGDFSMAHLEAD